MPTSAATIPPSSAFSDQRGERFLWVVSALLAACWMVMILLNQPDRTNGSTVAFGDGACFYCAGMLGAAGIPIYGDSIISCFTKTYFIHPPVSLPLFDLWARLPLPVAIALSYVAQAWAVGTILTVLWRRFIKGRWSLTARYGFVILILLSDSINFNLLVGQVNLMALALALQGVEWLSQRRAAASGAALLMAAVLKPYFIPLGLVLLPRENCKGLLVALIGGVSLCVLSLALYGRQLWEQFFDFHHKYLSAFSGIFMHEEWATGNNASLLATFERLGLSHADALLLWMGTIVLFVAISLAALWQLWKKCPGSDLAFAVVALMLALLFPLLSIAWPVYLPWLLPAAMWVGMTERRQLMLLALLMLPWGWLAQEASLAFLYPMTILSLLLLAIVWQRAFTIENKPC